MWKRRLPLRPVWLAVTVALFLMIVWSVVGIIYAILVTHDWFMLGSALASALLLTWCAGPAWRLSRQVSA
jgi:hypothetical protein